MDKAFINGEITNAMREHDKPRLSILRLVKNEIDVREKETKRDLTDEEVVAAFKKVLKQTGETLEGSIKVGTNAERTRAAAGAGRHPHRLPAEAGLRRRSSTRSSTACSPRPA